VKRAVRRLFKQLATERQFGWYVPDREWRRKLRALYPVEHVAAHHRQEFPPSFFNDHARRVMAFNAGLRE
jgi:hypothetical protein